MVTAFAILAMFLIVLQIFWQCPGVFCKIESDISLAAISRKNMQHTFSPQYCFYFGGKDVQNILCSTLKVFQVSIPLFVYLPQQSIDIKSQV